MTNPIEKIHQSDAMSVMAELETGYRTIRSASTDIMDGKAGYGYDPPLLPRLQQAMDLMQEVQRDIMLLTAMSSRVTETKMEDK